MPPLKSSRNVRNQESHAAKCFPCCQETGELFNQIITKIQNSLSTMGLALLATLRNTAAMFIFPETFERRRAPLSRIKGIKVPRCVFPKKRIFSYRAIVQ